MQVQTELCPWLMPMFKIHILKAPVVVQQARVYQFQVLGVGFQ
jgi:hypothetical protein